MRRNTHKYGLLRYYWRALKTPYKVLLVAFFTVSSCAILPSVSIKIGPSEAHAESMGQCSVEGFVTGLMAGAADKLMGNSGALATWLKAWGQFNCWMETTKSAFMEGPRGWNMFAGWVNRGMDDLEQTRNAIWAIGDLQVRLEEQKRQLDYMVQNAVMKNKDWTKVRLRKYNPESLVLVQDIDNLLTQINTLKPILAKYGGDSQKERAIQNSIKSRVDNTVLKGKAKAIEQEMEDNGKEAKDLAQCEKAEITDGIFNGQGGKTRAPRGPKSRDAYICTHDAMAIYEKLSTPTTQKIQLAQLETQLLISEMLVKIHDRLAIGETIDQKPMGKDVDDYISHRRSEIVSERK